MKLNLIERLFVNSPIRMIMQTMEVRWFKDKFPLDPGSEILEVGCGGGAGGRLILERFKPAQLYLSDLDIKMVRRARAYTDDRSLSNIHVCQADATELPYRDQKFDAVFGFGFLHHVPRWRTSLKDVGRILKPGAAYYLLEFYPQLYQNIITKHLIKHPEFDRFNSQDLRQALEDLNLNLIHSFEIKTMGIIGVGIKG
jgi:ubiquinone/menaquinone biosynthesis C-methylase UbiE